MEKYYTPTIEEINVGFECEIKNSSGEHFEWEHFEIISIDDARISYGDIYKKKKRYERVYRN